MTKKRADLKSLQHELLHRVAAHLARLGFDERPDGQSFYRRTEVGWWTVHLGFVEHPADFDVTVDVAIRVDAVETMINSSDKGLRKRARERTATVGIELGNLIDGRQRRWTVVAGNELPQIAISIAREVEDFGLPYLRRLSNLEQMLEVLKANDASAWKHSPIHGVRCKAVLALTLLLHGVEEARTVAPVLEQYLAQRKDSALDDFRAFALRALDGRHG